MSRSPAIFALLTFWTFATPADAQSLSFLTPQYIPIGDNCCSALTGDFNRDGRMDIVVAHRVSGLTVLLGNGDGSFTRIETPQPPVPGPVIATLIATADFNSDGILDLLVGIPSEGGERPAVMLGNGNGTFGSPAFVTLGPDNIMAVADFNGDGKPDLLVQLVDVSGFEVRLGNGDGTFRPTGPRTITYDNDSNPVVVGDFDRDGRLDVAQSLCCSSVRVWLGDGLGAFQYGGEAQDIYGLLAAGDLNRDGNLDLVSSGVNIALGNGDGTFRYGPHYYTPTLSGRYPAGHRLIVADLNGDGIPDIVYGYTVLLGKGDGSMQAPVIFGQWIDAFDTPFSADAVLAAVDLNGDGKLDLVGTGGDGNGLSVLINNTLGTDNSAAAVSAATLAGPVAPGSLATIFGKGLAATSMAAPGPPWPMSLGNVKVHVLDQNGVERLAGIVYVSPSQINFQVPPDTAAGYAIVNVDNGKTPFVKGALATPVQPVAAGFFTADGKGPGLAAADGRMPDGTPHLSPTGDGSVAAATAVRVQGGTRTPVPVFQCSSPGSCTPVPIDLSLGGTVYLSAYGTGFGTTAPSCYSLEYVHSDIQITYSGPQGEFPGLDQLNVPLPALQDGRVDIVCQFGRFTPYLNSAVFTIYIK